MNLKRFRRQIRQYYRKHGRDLPWRRTQDPYRILVSEVMLQQTQVERVVRKYPEFITAFPNWRTLAGAPLRQVLAVWQGIGYNRRALYLKRCAELVIGDFKGTLPSDPRLLKTLPGIGPYTARAVAAFAFNRPEVFIETNIRSVFIHHFFDRKQRVADSELLSLIEKTLDCRQPRRWYFALMDYGAMLKKKYGNPNRRSRHHFIQAPFFGSSRELRGKIVKLLVQARRLTSSQVASRLGIDQPRVKKTLTTLRIEGLVREQRGKFGV